MLFLGGISYGLDLSMHSVVWFGSLKFKSFQTKPFKCFETWIEPQNHLSQNCLNHQTNHFRDLGFIPLTLMQKQYFVLSFTWFFNKEFSNQKAGTYKLSKEENFGNLLVNRV